jgi:predicted transcriptional regulator
MMQMSQQIVEQMEANQTLQSELVELRGVSQSDVQELRGEFTKRIGMSEKKLQGVIKVWSRTYKPQICILNG